MKAIIALSFLCMIFSCSATSPGQPSQHLRNQWKKAVEVYSESPDGKEGVLATAFPINKLNLLTAGHFCEDVANGAEKKKYKETVSIRYFNRNDEISIIDNVQIIKFEVSDNVDLCILERAKHGLRAVDLVKNYEKSLNFGDKVYVVGAPSGIFPIITEGYVSYLYASEFNDKLLISSPVWAGNSGGPVFNTRGQVVGLVIMMDARYHHSTFAITAKSIREFLNAK